MGDVGMKGRMLTLLVLVVAVAVLTAGVTVLVLAYGGVLPAIGCGLIVASVGPWCWLLTDDGEAS